MKLLMHSLLAVVLLGPRPASRALAYHSNITNNRGVNVALPQSADNTRLLAQQFVAGIDAPTSLQQLVWHGSGE